MDFWIEAPFAVLGYFLIIGLIRYHFSDENEVYYDGIDFFINIFYLIFGRCLHGFEYFLWLLGSCIAVLVLTKIFEPIERLMNYRVYVYRRKKKTDDFN